MLKRSFALLLLIASAALAFAQDTSSDNSSSGGAGTPSASTETGSSSPKAEGSNGASGSATTPGMGSGANSDATEATPGTGTAPAGRGLFAEPTLPRMPSAPSKANGFDQGFDQGFNQGNPIVTGTGHSDTPAQKASSTSDGPTFSLPGGYGAAPQTLTAGEGTLARPPIQFSFSLQEGYNDNIYSSSGKKYPDAVYPAYTILESSSGFSYHRQIPQQTITGTTSNPVKGSMISSAYFGSQILLSASRLVVSADLSGGGTYYWDRMGNKYDPAGNVSLLAAYKLTSRAQLSTVISGAYTQQPNLNAVNSVQSDQGSYFTNNDKFDLSYQLTSRISTDSTYNISLQDYIKEASKIYNYTTNTYGQALRYAYSPVTVLVGEFRYSDTTYDSTTASTQTQYWLGGCDLTFSRRFTFTMRGGLSFRESSSTTTSDSSPFMESNLAYGFGKASTLNWSARYGFEDTVSTGASTSTVFRTNVAITEAFTPKFQASISAGFSNSAPGTVLTSSTTSSASSSSTSSSSFTTSTGASGNDSNSITLGLGSSYVLSPAMTLSLNYTRSQVISTTVATYSVNVVFLGATYHF